MDRPIVVCGLGRTGWRVLEYLKAANTPVVAIDLNARPEDPRLEGVRLVRGDCSHRDVLEAAGVARARGVLVLTSDDLVTISTMLIIRSLNPDVRVVLRLFNQNLIGRLGKAVKNVFALSTSLLTAPILAMTALTGQGLGAFRLEGPSDGRRQVVEVNVNAGSELRGRTLVQVTGIREAQVLAHFRPGEPARYLLDVDLEARLETGDQLIVCGEPRSLQALLVGAGEEDLPGLRWAGNLRRLGRVVGRTLAEMDRAVLICTSVFLLVVLVSTLILYRGQRDAIRAGNTTTAKTLGHALFRTIGIMATGGPLPEDEFSQDNEEGMKVFVSTLRVFGAALTAAFTAIVTNFLLRARLRGALEVRRIPEGGHFVVSGLSPTGFRVVEELIGGGEKVVVIEMDPANRFVTTARRLGAAVILGDAAVAEVLRQAHAGTARAVIAATNNDMANLETALLVRELNPAQRVVLLLSEPQMAQMLREAANVRLAVSAPALAAPAFVAELLGDRILCVILLHDHLLVVLDLQVQEGDRFAGQIVRTVAVDYRLLPVAVLPPEGPVARQPLEARLSAGDRLVAVLALADLQRLLRRQPPPAPYTVEVTSFPLPTRGWLAGLVRTEKGWGAEEAEKALDTLPMCLGTNLTRGQAETLLARLARERVSAHLLPLEGSKSPSLRPEGHVPARRQP